MGDSDISGDVPEAELIPQAHGGALRKGNPGGRTNTKRAAIAKIEAGIPGVVSVLVTKALEGDPRSIELCLAYGIGKPKDTVEIMGSGGGPIFLAPVLARLSDDELDAAARRIAGGLDDDPAREGEAEEAT